MCDGPGKVAAAGEASFMEQVRRLLTQLLAGHTCSADDDRAILSKMEGSAVDLDTTARRLHMATRVRLREKEILQAAIDALDA